jgi:FtsZ-binding cell division protein ZapB
LISVLDALVTACVSGYTELQPEFQELKEKMRKIAENEKEEAHQEEQ